MERRRSCTGRRLPLRSSWWRWSSWAIELARQAAPHAADYPEVTVAEAGPFGPLFGCDTFDLDIDYLDGRTYGVFNFRG